jgi:hypothetical protein
MRFPSRTVIHFQTGLRWAARGLAAVLVGIVVVIFIGQGFNPLRLTPSEAVQMMFFWATCIGMMIAWRWELLGGGLATVSMTLFYLNELMLTGRFPHGFMFRLMLLPGLLFLASGISRRCITVRR